MKASPWDFYNRNAARLFSSYESVSFEDVHRSLIPFLPKGGASCLDIGAGSGRDAEALAKKGYNVLAVEPSDNLRALAEDCHLHPKIQWIDDSLPGLPNVKARSQKFQFILVSAVWMHVSTVDRVEALSSLASLLDNGGYVAFALRFGPTLDDRLAFPTPIEELAFLAGQKNLLVRYLSDLMPDEMGRKDVRWQKIVLQKTD